MKLAGVETARGVAALLVVLAHTTVILADQKSYGREFIGGLFLFGRAGVDFFFVLSGFIILYVHRRDLDRPERLAGYAYKRFVRIFPAYWMIYAFFFAILLASPTRTGVEREPVQILVSTFLLPSHREPTLSVAWTLRHELLFYALFAVGFLNLSLGRALLVAWGGLIALNIAWFFISGGFLFGGLLNGLVFSVFNIEFFCGMAVALITLRGGRAFHPFALLALGAVLFCGMGLIEDFVLPSSLPEASFWPPKHTVYAAGSALTLYGLVAAERAGRLRIPAALVAVGTASYAIYLVHVIAVMFVQQALRIAQPIVPIPLWLGFILAVAAALAAGMAFSFAVEQPVLARLRAWRLPRPAVP